MAPGRINNVREAHLEMRRRQYTVEMSTEEMSRMAEQQRHDDCSALELEIKVERSMVDQLAMCITHRIWEEDEVDYVLQTEGAVGEWDWVSVVMHE